MLRRWQTCEAKALRAGASALNDCIGTARLIVNVRYNVMMLGWQELMNIQNLGSPPARTKSLRGPCPLFNARCHFEKRLGNAWKGLESALDTHRVFEAVDLLNVDSA